MRKKIDKVDFVFMGGASLLALALRLIPGARLIDDAYITYRYAANLIGGHGLVYNPGEAVLGTTTPLYALILAAIGGLAQTTALPVISPILNALFDAVGIAALYAVTRKLLNHRVPALAAAVLWACSPQSITFAVGGMETSLSISLLFLTVAAYVYRKYQLTAVGLALSVLTRPDALIWAGPLGLGLCIVKWVEARNEHWSKRLPLSEGATFLAIVVPWIVFATIVYGSPVPHSISAKAVAYALPPEQGLIAMVQHFSTPFMEFTLFGPVGAIAGFVIYIPLSAIGGLFLYTIDKRTLPIALYPWVFAGVFTAANPLIFRWYTAAALAIFILCLVSGVWGLAHRLSSKFAPKALTVVTLVWLGIAFSSWHMHPDHGPDRPAPDMAWYKLELLYRQAAEIVKPQLRDNSVVAAADIGAVGWFTGAKILDTLGLISPEATQYYPLDAEQIAGAAYAISTDLVIDQKPDYIIFLEIYGRNTLLKDARFTDLYRLFMKLETEIYESDGMLIYERITGD